MVRNQTFVGSLSQLAQTKSMLSVPGTEARCKRGVIEVGTDIASCRPTVPVSCQREYSLYRSERLSNAFQCSKIAPIPLVSYTGMFGPSSRTGASTPDAPQCDARRAGRDPRPWQARRLVMSDGYRAPRRDPVSWQVRLVATPGWYGTSGRDPRPWQARGVVTSGWYGTPGRDPPPWQACLLVTLGWYSVSGCDPPPWQLSGVGFFSGAHPDAEKGI